ncbi:hypothetical protein Tco_1070952 [Tanacetum coccineum]|uniref:Uncharacterized protein n=1 Tax=Tanacetum coccineum TaxID=301880 RepID=A0ABQ5HPN4_9ASTR
MAWREPDLHPLGFSGNSQYEIASIPHDENSHLYLKQEDFLQPQLSPDVYMSYLLEGATTLSNSCDYGYYEDTKRDLMFDGLQSVGSGYGSSSNGEKEMDLVEMQRKDLWAAEESLLEAIAVDPINPYYAATYANFLWSNGPDDTCFPSDSPEFVAKSDDS